MKIIIEVDERGYRVGVEDPIEGIDMVGTLTRVLHLVVAGEVKKPEPAIKIATPDDITKLGR